MDDVCIQRHCTIRLVAVIPPTQRSKTVVESASRSVQQSLTLIFCTIVGGKQTLLVYASDNNASVQNTMANMFENRPSNDIAKWIRQTYSADMIEIDEFRQKEVTLKLPHDLEDINLLFEDIEREFIDHHIAFKFFMSCGQPRVALDISAKDSRPRSKQTSSHLITIITMTMMFVLCAAIIYTTYPTHHVQHESTP